MNYICSEVSMKGQYPHNIYHKNHYNNDNNNCKDNDNDDSNINTTSGEISENDDEKYQAYKYDSEYINTTNSNDNGKSYIINTDNDSTKNKSNNNIINVLIYLYY